MLTKTFVTGLVAALMAPCAAVAEGNFSVVTNGTEVTIDLSGGAPQSTVCDAYGSEITKVIKTGKDVLEYQPASPTSYGALEVLGGQFRIHRADALGAGTVLIDGYDAPSQTPATLVTYGANYTLTNKLVFGSHGYLMPVDNAPVVTSVGSTQAEGSRFVRLGRTDKQSAATLALTGADSEAIDQIRVRGLFDLTLNGGTLKVAATAASPFLYDINDGAFAKTCTIARGGVTVDVAEGADVAFGTAPTFSQPTVVTNCVETWQPSNYSFENSTTGWTFGSNTNVTPQETSTVYANGSAFDKYNDTAWPTTNGTHYAMIRRTGFLSRTVTLPTNGLWRMTFEMGCRPLDSYSWNIETTVKIDGAVVLTIPAITSSAGKHAFKRYETAFGELQAGEHAISVELSDSTSSYASLNFDCFQFERAETAREVPRLTKSGAGNLRLAGVTVDDGAIDVAAGRLKLASPDLGSNTVVTVAAGATLTFTNALESIVKNGSFESPVLAAGDYAYSSPTDWTRSLTDSTGTYHNGSGNGYQANGSAFSGTLAAPHGNQTAYLRNYAKYEQTLTGVAAGTYRLAFAQGRRSGYDSHLIRTSVKIDGTEVISVEPGAKGDNAFATHEALVTLTAGDHTLSFDTTGTVTITGASVLIDDVRLEKVEESVFAGEVRVASGATLALENLRKVTIERFFVDGELVSGGRAALRSAGVTVTGDGQIRVGPRRGLALIVR